VPRRVYSIGQMMNPCVVTDLFVLFDTFRTQCRQGGGCASAAVFTDEEMLDTDMVTLQPLHLTVARKQHAVSSPMLSVHSICQSLLVPGTSLHTVIVLHLAAAVLQLDIMCATLMYAPSEQPGVNVALAPPITGSVLALPAMWAVEDTAFPVYRALDGTQRLLSVIESCARYHACMSNWLHIVRQRRVLSAPFGMAAGRHFHTVFNHARLHRREPHSSVREKVAELAYGHQLQFNEVWEYVQMYPNQSSDSPMIAVMNSVVAPETIRVWQTSLNGHRVMDICKKQHHPYRGLMFLAVFGSYFHDMFHTPWFDQFLIDGYQRCV
jgi:hypothetical protein